AGYVPAWKRRAGSSPTPTCTARRSSAAPAPSYMGGGLLGLKQILRSQAQAHELMARILDAVADEMRPSERDRRAFDVLVENHWPRPSYRWLGVPQGTMEQGRIHCAAVYPPGTAQLPGVQQVLEEFRAAACRYPVGIARCGTCGFPFIRAASGGGTPPL